MALLLLLVSTSCTESTLDYEHPDVDVFVKQLKDGSLSVQSPDGVSQMPKFTPKDIGELLDYADDLSVIPSFPLAPVSYSAGGNSPDPSETEGRCRAIGNWVGKSHKYILVKENEESVGTLTIVNSLSEPRPEAETYKFAMPGDTGTVRYSVYLADADKGTMSPVDIGRFKDQKLLLPPLYQYPHTDRYVYFVRVSRTLDTLDLVRIDVTDSSVRTLISEKCSPHFNEVLFDWHVINDGREILWWSERDGRGRYYLYDGEGNLVKPVTPDNVIAGKIKQIDTAGRAIIYAGYGEEEGTNPCYRFYYRSTFGGRHNLLTPGDGYHTISLSPDGKYVEDTYSRMDLAPRTQICDLDGKVRFRMEPADLSRLYDRGWKEPELVEFTAADSVTKLYGVVYLPFDPDPSGKYPVISNVYPGPMTDLVPLSFSLDDNYNQSLAQLGFIVVNVSYRGSNPYRGPEFYNFGYGNLRDYALDDDYAVLQQVAEKYPFADLGRVGIYGHSGGGFMAVAAMLSRPDFYKVAVAASGNHDNNIYNQWWGETFHGVRHVTHDDGSEGYRDVCTDAPVTITLTTTSPNYDVSEVEYDGAVTISARQVDVHWNNEDAGFQNFVYDGTDQISEVTAYYEDIGGNHIPLNVSTTTNGGVFKDYADNGYLFTAEMTSEDRNYSLTGNTAAYVMQKREVHVTINDDTVEYGDLSLDIRWQSCKCRKNQ